MIIDGSDNADYFIYKFNLSKKDQKRILFLNNFFSTKINSKIFSVNNLRKILYFNGKQALLDLLYFQVFRSKKIDKKIYMIDHFKGLQNFSFSKPIKLQYVHRICSFVFNIFIFKINHFLYLLLN